MKAQLQGTDCLNFSHWTCRSNILHVIQIWRNPTRLSNLVSEYPDVHKLIDFYKPKLLMSQMSCVLCWATAHKEVYIFSTRDNVENISHVVYTLVLLILCLFCHHFEHRIGIVALSVNHMIRNLDGA
jgi:hypothetical protein